MSVICAVDLTATPSRGLSTMAGAIAARLDTSTVLVHGSGTANAQVHALRQRQMKRLVSAVKRTGAHAEALLFATGQADATAEAARLMAARLVVVSNTVEAGRLARRIDAPLLIVSDAEPIMDWLAGKRSLRVFLATDLGSMFDAERAFVSVLREIAPCDVVVCHVVWPPGERARAGMRGPLRLDAVDPEIEREIRGDLERRIGDLPGRGEVRFQIVSSLGRVGSAVVELAQREDADIIVVGNHQKRGVDLLWQGSVSREVIRSATTNVACVSRATAQEAAVPLPLGNIVVATDFSAAGNEAIRHACSLVSSDGVLHLLHVVVPGRAEAGNLGAHARARLVERAAASGVRTEVHVIEGNDVADVVCDLAERVDAGAICLGRRPRSAPARALLGSVVRDVLGRTSRPVLLTGEGDR